MRLLPADVRQFLLNRPVIPGVVMLRQSYVLASNRPMITATCAFAARRVYEKGTVTPRAVSNHKQRDGRQDSRGLPCGFLSFQRKREDLGRKCLTESEFFLR